MHGMVACKYQPMRTAHRRCARGESASRKSKCRFMKRFYMLVCDYVCKCMYVTMLDFHIRDASRLSLMTRKKRVTHIASLM